MALREISENSDQQMTLPNSCVMAFLFELLK
jgi:hypothetical protein